MHVTIYGLMTFLIVLTLLALVVLAGIVAYAYITPQAEAEVVPVGFSDVAIITYRELGDRTEKAWHMLLPYLHHAVAHALSRYLAFRDRMYMRIFGQAAVPRGGATSYFLKRVLAHKEDFRRMMAEKAVLHDSEPKESGRDIFLHLRK